MNSYLNPILAYCFCLLLTVSNAQDVIPRFETISVNEGLSQSSVYSIHQDRKGFMWFGTADGLNRYDGQEIRVFKVKDPQAVANSNFIRGALLENVDGNLWFCNETGIYYFDQAQEKIQTAYSFKENANARIYYPVSIDGKYFWLATHTDGLVRFSLATREITSFPYPPACNPYHVALDWCAWGSDIFFSVVGTQGVFRFEMKEKKYELLFGGRDLKAYVHHEKLYVFSEDEIEIRDSSLAVVKTFHLRMKEKAPIRSMLEDNFGRLWVCTGTNGLYCHLPAEGKTIIYRHDNAKLKTLPSDIVTRIFADRGDNLWIGTDGGGVARLDLKPPKFNLFPLNEGDYPMLKDYFTKCFYEDGKGRIWFGTHHIGLVIFNPVTGAVEHYVNDPADAWSLPGNIVGAILKDRDGNVWIGHNRGISLFDENKKKFRSVILNPPPQLSPVIGFVYKIIQRRNGDLVVATTQGLIIIPSKNDAHGNYHGWFPEMQWSSLITDIVEADDGTVWVTSPINGLFHYSDQLKFLPGQRYFNSLDLRSLCQDSRRDSILWIGSGKGLIRFNTDTKTSRVFDESNGFSNSFVYGVLEDSVHNFWLSTNGGLTYFHADSSVAQNFSVNDGLQSNEFNTGAYYRGPSGNFYFGGIRGFNWFHSGNLHLSPRKPGVAITAISVNDVAVRQDSLFQSEHRLSLRYDENSLSFQFAALDFTRPQANKIQYLLQGWDKNWVMTPSKTARLSNLKPGNYLLRVKSSNSSGVWSDEEQLPIFIQPPFWAQAWFFVLAVLSLTAVVVVALLRIIRVKVRDRIRELEKEKAIDAERLRISKDMHDEIGSGLTHIALLSELMSTQQRTTGQMKNEVGTISSTAQKLVQSMGEIIWVTHTDNDTMENLLSYLREQTRLYFEPFEVNYTIDLADNIPNIKLSNVQRRNLFLVTKESLNNALKHAQATAVSFSVKAERYRLIFEVSDNGRGILSQTVRNNSNGFRNMRSRMEEIGGTWEIKSEVGGGTVIRYTIGIDP